MEIKIEELTAEQTKETLKNMPKRQRGKYKDTVERFEKLPVGHSIKLILPYKNEQEYKHANSVAGTMWNKFRKTGKAEVTRTTTDDSIIVLITKKAKGE
jgi:hypothetical protein